MSNAFDSARRTLARAEHHINDFEATISRFIDDRPWTYVVDKQPDPDQNVHKIRVVHELPESLPCILFDAVNNLRAVLDQSGFAALVASGAPESRNTNFPFGDDAAQVDGNIKRASKALPAEIFALFRGFNPHKGGNDTLWALNKLCNAKKHCALIPMVVANAKTTFVGELSQGDFRGFFFGGAAPGAFQRTMSRAIWDPVKREMTLVAIPSHIEVNIHGHFAFDIAIDGIEILRYQPAVGVLHTMSSEVQRVLMATEAECRRLGFIA